MIVGPVDTDRRVLVIAEIGNNHEGDFARAAEMVRRAADCGAGGVKFQSVTAEHFVRQSEAARYTRLRGFELSSKQFGELSDLARGLGLAFLSTPMNMDAANYLEPMVDAYKIASGDNDFLPLLARAAQSGKPILLSTGISDVARIDAAVDFLLGQWKARGVQGELALLHCVCSYPTPADQANLRSISFLAERFDVEVGYSDHVQGIEAAAISVALGARIVEKHFTLDKNQSDFRDHQLSADPPEMAELVRRIRDTEAMLGRPGKRIEPCEEAAKTAVRRSIVAARALKAGTRLAAADLKWIRPQDGLRPGSEDLLIGRTLKRDVEADHLFSIDDVE